MSSIVDIRVDNCIVSHAHSQGAKVLVRTTERAVPLEAAPDVRRLGARSGRTAPDPHTGLGESCRPGPAGQDGS